MSELLPRIVGATMVIGGIGIIIRSIRNLAEARAARRWPTVQGTILESRLIELGGSPEKYTSAIRFRYQVADETHESDRPTFFGLHTKTEIETFVERFPVGSEHSVYHHPDEPGNAVLVPGVYGKNSTHGIAMGLILALAGCGVLVAGL